MTWMRFFRRVNWQRERDREIESHLEFQTNENLTRGMPPEEARAAARRTLGNSTLVREEIYRMNTVALTDSLVRNLRYALRSLRRNPMFTVLTVAILALGIGASTAIFSLVQAVLLRQLPYDRPGDVFWMWSIRPDNRGPFNIPDYLDYRD